MLRKLIQLSPSTSVVSLPSQWIRKNNIKKGSSLVVEEKDNIIVVSPQGIHIEKEVTIDISSLSEKMMWVLIDSAYVSGYDTIIVITKNQKQTLYMSEVVRNYPGMIIDEERTGRVRIKTSGDADTDLGRIVSRIFNMTIAVMEDAIDSMKGKDFAALAEMKKRDYVINSYVAFALRHLNRLGMVPMAKTSAMYSYVKLLEMYADKLCALCVSVGEGKKLVRGVLSGLQSMLELYRKVQFVHGKYSIEKLSDIEAGRRALMESVQGEPPQQDLQKDIAALFFDFIELEAQLNI